MFRWTFKLLVLSALAMLVAADTADEDFRITTDHRIGASTLSRHLAEEKAVNAAAEASQDVHIGGNYMIKGGADKMVVLADEEDLRKDLLLEEARALIEAEEQAKSLGEGLLAARLQEDESQAHAADEAAAASGHGRPHHSSGKPALVVDSLPAAEMKALSWDKAVEHTLRASHRSRAVGKRDTLLNPDIALTNVDQAVDICVLDNDIDPAGGLLDPSTVAVVVSPMHGVAVPSAAGDGKITYSPEAGYGGQDEFTYTVCDSEVPANCATSTVTVTMVQQLECNEYLGMPINTIEVCLHCWANEQISAFVSDEIVPALMNLRRDVERYDPQQGVAVGPLEYSLDQRVYSNALRHFAVEECLDADELFVDDEWVAPYYAPNGYDSLHAFYELNTLILGTLVDSDLANIAL